jgi:hypothetical protein
VQLSLQYLLKRVRIPQVSVAALLDNFISSSSQIEIEEKLKEADLCMRDRLERNPMEPLLIKLAREFTDSQDLSDRLLKLYKVANQNLKHLNPSAVTFEPGIHYFLAYFQQFEIMCLSVSFCLFFLLFIVGACSAATSSVHSSHSVLIGDGHGQLRRSRQQRVLHSDEKAGTKEHKSSCQSCSCT